MEKRTAEKISTPKNVGEPSLTETVEEKLYKLPMIYVVAGAAVAALAICLFITLVMLVFGFGYRSDVINEGAEVRYFGVMRDGSPRFGWLRLDDGTRAFVTKSKIKYSDGSRYEGELSGFNYSGQGKYTDPEGNVYTGTFVDGKLNGEVKIRYADGGRFEGTYVNGLCEGYGESIHKGDNGEWGYKGDYVAGEEDGYGEFTYPDGSVYKGYFKDGMRHGQGKYRFASGDTYTGEFRNNVITGNGSYMFIETGRVYAGKFSNGIPVFD